MMLQNILDFKLPYFILSILLLLTEIYIGMYVHDSFVRPYVGDFLVVILLYCLIMAFWKTPPIKSAIGVLIFSFALEIMQYFNLVKLLGLQDIKLARIIIGTSFAWVDLLAYALGIGVVLAIEGYRTRKQ